MSTDDTFPSTKNKLRVAPGCADLAASDDAPTVLVTGGDVAAGFWLDLDLKPTGVICLLHRAAVLGHLRGRLWLAVVSAACGARAAVSSPSTLQAERRLLPSCLMASSARLKVFVYLLLWRNFCYVMRGSHCGDPSGRVHGIATVAHGTKRDELCGEGAGHCVLLSTSELLGAKRKDLFVSFNLSKVL